MRTPAGTECKYFFGDYYRGKNHEECRLIGNVAPPHHWTPDLCQKCPVPRILLANSCPNMILSAQVKRTFLGIKRQVVVSAYCTKSQTDVKEPEVGCGQCHPLPPVFTQK